MAEVPVLQEQQTGRLLFSDSLPGFLTGVSDQTNEYLHISDEMRRISYGGLMILLTSLRMMKQPGFLNRFKNGDFL